MTIRTEHFGNLPDGRNARVYTVSNATGMSVSLSDYGARIVSMLAPDAAGRLADVALGYDTLAPYIDADACLGAICGRVANRIGGGAFRMNGNTWEIAKNIGPNTLHGGINGFHRRLFTGEQLSDGVCFHYVSADEEEGFPGKLTTRVSYRLSEENTLSIDYDMISDRDTIVNLTNHCYFNLAGHGSGDIHAQQLMINANFYTPMSAELIPTGEIASVSGTPFDFRQPKAIGRDIDADNEQLRRGGGYDHNFVLTKPERGELTLAASAEDTLSGRMLEVWTTMPGVQLYTSNALERQVGKGGAMYDRRGAFCLETQLFPNAMACTHFPSPILKANERLCTRTEFRFIR